MSSQMQQDAMEVESIHDPDSPKMRKQMSNDSLELSGPLFADIAHAQHITLTLLKRFLRCFSTACFLVRPSCCDCHFCWSDCGGIIGRAGISCGSGNGAGAAAAAVVQ